VSGSPGRKAFQETEKYVPERGDIVKLNFDPTLGREQATRLALACPITSKVKGFNLEVLLPEGLITNGAVLAFQVKMIDWVKRQVKYIESLPDETIEEVISKLQVLLG
jgi:mRNA interferase MazF